MLVLGLGACGKKSEFGARSVDALMLTYFNALSTKDVKMFYELLVPVDLSWGVYNEADRADEKAFRKVATEKLQVLEKAFLSHATEFGGFKIGVLELQSEPEQPLNVVWSAEPYGKVSKVVVTVMRDGKQYKYYFSNVMQYRGKYYLEESPFVDIKRWE